MFGRLRTVMGFLLAAAGGYLLGSGPLSDWIVDCWQMLNLSWQSERLSRGPNSTFPLLMAGYLLGQGAYIIARQMIRRFDSLRIKNAETVASWDPSLQLGTRFGLHRYLERCVTWAAEDPTSRTQALALFKVRGLGELNDRQGTLATTRLLQRIATELRAAALPEAASALRRWLAHYLPRPLESSMTGLVSPRYAARWTGSTFALAFRELDAVQAVSISREVAGWISGELAKQQSAAGLILCSSIAIGIPCVTARGLAAAAVRPLNDKSDSAITVVHDAADVRTNVLGTMSNVAHLSINMERRDQDPSLNPTPSGIGQFLQNLLRDWGFGFACIFGAVLLMYLTGSKGAPLAKSYAWPPNFTEVELVDSTGVHTVHLVRHAFPAQSSANWSLSDVTMAQGNPADGFFAPVQIHLTITNRSEHRYYVGASDFAAIDANGHRFEFDPQRMLHFDQGITGRWLSPGDSWSGGMIISRGIAPIEKIVFQPDRVTRIELSSSNP